MNHQNKPITKVELQRKIGNRLKYLRRRHKLTQLEFSKLTKIGRPYISMLESGKFMPTVFLCMKIAKAFNMSLDEFIYC